jgi:NhaP-type Na+/H+ or K+/H+ antiporter
VEILSRTRSLSTKVRPPPPPHGPLRSCLWLMMDGNRSILIKLIPVNLLLGVLPSQQTLNKYELYQFIPLLQAFKAGNIVAWRRELEVNREWYRRRSIWLLLFERGEILVWRNLFRNRSVYPSLLLPLVYLKHSGYTILISLAMDANNRYARSFEI